MHRKDSVSRSLTCPVCHRKKNPIDVFSGQSIRPSLKTFITKYAPDWSFDNYICVDCLNRARTDLLENFLISEKGELNKAEEEVLRAIRSQEIVALDPSLMDKDLTLGQRLADKLAELGGSWRFILSFMFFLLVWVAFNSYNYFFKPFDPYPFILLNLILSCLAALQAPVIMMSQNRKESKDRQRAEADYKTNLKAELEIRHLHTKLDQVITHQWHELLKLEQDQLDILKENVRDIQGNHDKI